MSTVRFSVPPLSEAATAAAQRVLGSGWFTTGPECGAFETELAEYLGQPHVVSLTSCTHALELSLRALRLDPGAVVLTPSLTFCGAVAAIVHAGYRPALVDINETTLVPDEATVRAAVERVGTVAAMVICDLGGYPVDHVALAAAANLPYRRIVVDAAHGPGGLVGRAEAETAPYATCLSFYATKNLPIGEGGAVATFDADLAEWLHRARLHGMSKDAWRRYLPGGSWRYDVPEIGFKANLTDLQAAIGREQLRALPAWQERRTELVARYDAALAGAVEAGVLRQPVRPDGHSLHLYQVLINQRKNQHRENQHRDGQQRGTRRDEVAAALSEAGIGTSVHFIPVHQLTAYIELLGRDECATVPVTDRIADELLSLPLYPDLTDADVDLVTKTLTEVSR